MGQRQLATDTLHGLLDPQCVRGEIHVSPAQPQHLALAQAQQQRDVVERLQPVPGDGREQPLALLRAQHR